MDPTEAPRDRDRPAGRRLRTWVNWALAALTVGGAALVMLTAVGAVLSTAACSTDECPDTGPGGVLFGVLYYGAPVVAVLTVLVSFFTAARPRGVIVPLSALGLLTADLVALTVAFSG